MDMEEFIAEVRKRECLWDKKKIPFGAPQRKIANGHWADIGKNFNISGELAKCKWRSLRDHFLKLLKKSPAYNATDIHNVDENEKPNWIHFNKLIFLLNVYKPSQKAESVNDIHCSSDSESSFSESKSPTNEKASLPSPQPPPPTHPIRISGEEASQPSTTKTVDNFSPADNTYPRLRKVYKLEENYDSNNCDVVQVKEESERATPSTESHATLLDISTPLAMIKPLASDPPFKNIKRIYTLEDTIDLELAAPEEEQYKCSTKKIARASEVKSHELRRFSRDCNDENDNLSFFQSILPFMNKLDPMQQLRVRMRFQEIVMEELGA